MSEHCFEAWIGDLKNAYVRRIWHPEGQSAIDFRPFFLSAKLKASEGTFEAREWEKEDLVSNRPLFDPLLRRAHHHSVHEDPGGMDVVGF